MHRIAAPIAFAVFCVGLLVAWTVLEAAPAQNVPVAAPLVVSARFEREVDSVRRNETLTHLFARHNVEGAAFFQMLGEAREHGLNPRRVSPKLAFQFRRAVHDSLPDLVEVRVRRDSVLRLVRLTDGDDEWRAESIPVVWSVRNRRIDGTITNSLNDAIHSSVSDSLLPYAERDALIWYTAEAVYGWVIDFTRDIRTGDRFHIVFERMESDLGEVQVGRVLAARIETQGVESTAYAMNDSGITVYFDDQGQSLHRSFLRYPVQFRRISSGFSRRRFHPVLKRYRAHLGYDFAADTGTPIRATGDGVVRAARRDGGYGIMVAIRHPKGIETRYAHMSRIESGIRPGVRVTQGQTIGRVGMTGTATGPHVHYEFLKNGRHVNYRNVDLGDVKPIPEELRHEFETARSEYNLLLYPPAPKPRTLLGGQ